jgi:hypothetical protein
MDPYGGSMEAYRSCASQIEEAVTGCASLCSATRSKACDALLSSRRVLAWFGPLCAQRFLVRVGAQPGAMGNHRFRLCWPAPGRSIGAARAYDIYACDGSWRCRCFCATGMQQNARGLWCNACAKLMQKRALAFRRSVAHALGYTLAEKASTRNSLPPPKHDAPPYYLHERFLLERALQQPGAACLNSVRFSRAISATRSRGPCFGRSVIETLSLSRSAPLPKRFNRAARLIPQADLNRSLVELHFHLGEIYRALGRFDDARTQYQLAQKGR